MTFKKAALLARSSSVSDRIACDEVEHVSLCSTFAKRSEIDTDRESIPYHGRRGRLLGLRLGETYAREQGRHGLEPFVAPRSAIRDLQRLDAIVELVRERPQRG